MQIKDRYPYFYVVAVYVYLSRTNVRIEDGNLKTRLFFKKFKIFKYYNHRRPIEDPSETDMLDRRPIGDPSETGMPDRRHIKDLDMLNRRHI